MPLFRKKPVVIMREEEKPKYYDVMHRETTLLCEVCGQKIPHTINDLEVKCKCGEGKVIMG